MNSPDGSPPFTTYQGPRRSIPLHTRLWPLPFLTAAAFITGCAHKDLIYPLTDGCKVQVVFDWSHASDAKPEGMALIFYPCNSETGIWRFDIAGRNGGYVELPAGEYKVLTVNNDLPGVRFVNTGYMDTFKATGIKLDDEDIVPTGMLYATTIGTDASPALSVPSFTDSWSATLPEPVITLTPDSLCTVLHLDISNLSDARRLRSAYACLSETPYALLIETDRPEGPMLHTRFSLDPIVPDSSINIHGYASMFGTPLPDIKYELTLTAVMTDASVLKKKFDVTSQLSNSPWLRNVFIKLRDVRLPTGTGDSTGSFEMGADVDGWTNVIIEITTGP